jgi:hypothetical protein
MPNTRKHWLCTIQGCGKPHRAKGYCSAHYWSWRNNGDPLIGRPRQLRMSGKCLVNGCDKKARSGGMCHGHYKKARLTANPVHRIRQIIYLRVYHWWPETKKKALIRSRSSQSREVRRKYLKTYRHDPKERWRLAANAAVRSAKKSGRLRQNRCEECGEPKSQAHHDSYLRDKWLSIRWLCSLHHTQWHKLNIPEYPSESEMTDL